MALKTGELKPDENEGIILNEGMSLGIYKKLDFYLSPPLQEAINKAKKLGKKEGKEKAVAAAQKALDKARQGWKKLAYSIAFGVIEHIKSNMEIKGITTRGNVTIDVQGNTKPEVVGGHTHPVDISSTKENVVFTQNNDGTGHVQ